MVKTVRDFVDIIATGNPAKMLAAIRENLAEPDAGAERPEGNDEGLPVSGQCTVATYPIYLASSTSNGFTINPLKRISGAVSGALPFGADKANPSYLTPAPDLGSWQEIKAENMPGFCSKVMVVGPYEIWVDRQYPGGRNKFENYTPVRLIADFLLRIDTKHKVYDEAVQAGCCYISGCTQSSTAICPIAMLTRMDAAIELNIQSFTWRLMEGIPEPSSLCNKSQHRRFAALAKEGTYELTGEQIGKLVLSCEDGLNTMAQVYKDNIEEFLSLTRFKVLHPIDTVGVFMRESQSLAMVQTIPNTIPTKHHFPVWLHDTVLQRWYRISAGFTRVSEDTLPPELGVAGTMCGVYEVVYDTTARDKYTARQLAWLTSIVMQSQYIPVSDAVVAMRGCMERINSIFAHALTPEVVSELEPVPGTRIPDLSSDPVWVNQVEAVVALSHNKTSAYCYNTIECAVTNYKTWPDKDKDVSAAIYIGGDGADTRVLCNMLLAFSRSDMLYGWENVIAHDDEMEELVEPPAACVEFYSTVPHAYDPPIVTRPIPIYLKYGEAIYALTYAGDRVCWGVADEVDPKAEAAGEFFGGSLYCVSGESGSFTNSEFTDIIRSTLAMFGDFSKAPTVYRYLYTIGSDDSWSRVGEPDSEDSIYLASVKQDTVLRYSISKNLWSVTAQQLSNVNCSNRVVGLLLPGTMTSVRADMVSDMLKSLQACTPGLVKSSPGVQVSQMMRTPRGAAKECAEPKYSVKYKEISYTYNGALCTCDAVQDSELSPSELMEFLVAWIEQMLTFQQHSGAYAELSKWGLDFGRVPQSPSEADIGAFLYFNDRYYVDMCLLNRRLPGDFHFPPRDNPPEAIGVGVFLECDGYRGITLEELAALCSRVGRISAILSQAVGDGVACPDSEDAAQMWYNTRPLGVSTQKRRNALMYQLNEKPMLAVWFQNGDVTGWAGDGWASSRIDGLKEAGGRIYYDEERAKSIVDVDTAKSIIERCIIFNYTPEGGKYRYLRALKMMR